MKSHTTLKQSKRLSKIIPVETADMLYGYDIPYSIPYSFRTGVAEPCWSLAALLDVLDKAAYLMNEDASVSLSSYKTIKWTVGIDNSDLELITEDNPVDACVKMIIKLHELNLL